MAGDGFGSSNPNTPAAKRPRCCVPDYPSDDEAIPQQEKADPLGVSSSSHTSATESATLADLSVFYCPICFEPLLSTVYQCENGHIACDQCCTWIENTCPSCFCDIGTIRCRAVEKILESVTVKCQNMQYGCKETFKFNDKLHHEEFVCRYSPCTCPYVNCDYVGLPESFFQHVGVSHSPDSFTFNATKSITMYGRQTRVFLQDISRKTLFVLRRTFKSSGRYLSVACVGPNSMRGAFSFHLTAEVDDDTFVKVKAPVVCVREWTAESVLGTSLVLPRGMMDEEWGTLKLKLVIRRNPVVKAG